MMQVIDSLNVVFLCDGQVMGISIYSRIKIKIARSKDSSAGGARMISLYKLSKASDPHI